MAALIKASLGTFSKLQLNAKHIMLAYVDLGIVRQRRKRLIKSLVHLSSITFEETATSYSRIRAY